MRKEAPFQHFSFGYVFRQNKENLMTDSDKQISLTQTTQRPNLFERLA